MLRSEWNLQGDATGARTLRRGTATAGRHCGRSGLALLTLFVQRTIPSTFKRTIDAVMAGYRPACSPDRPCGAGAWPARDDRRRTHWLANLPKDARSPLKSDVLGITSMVDRASFGTVTYEGEWRVERLPPLVGTIVPPVQTGRKMPSANGVIGGQVDP